MGDHDDMLGDLDFTSDICCLAQSYRNVQGKLDLLEVEAVRTGLR